MEMVNYNINSLKCSDRDGYGGNRDRDYSEHRSGGSYRDSYKSYGKSTVTAYK